MADIILGVMILAPPALVYSLKSNAALGFLTVCVSFVLSTSVIGDLKSLLSELNLSTTDSTIGLVLLIVPFLITLFLTRYSASKHGLKMWFEILVAICAGGLLALSVGPVLNSSAYFSVTDSSFWDQLQSIQSIIIGVGAFFSLLLIWFGGLKGSSKHK